MLANDSRTESRITGRHRARLAGAVVVLAWTTVVGSSASAATAKDTTPPTTPTNFRVTAMTPNSVSLGWNPSADNRPGVTYQIFINTSLILSTSSTSHTFGGLYSNVTYRFSVRARDAAGNVSAMSPTLSATPPPPLPPDTTPPTQPGNLTGFDEGRGQLRVTWTESTDNQTPQWAITYEIFVEGILDHYISGGETVVCGAPGSPLTVTVVATDGPGNRSAPATITVVLGP